jgi:predicted AlkP superfamily pyrophosphatase or phosphodiesterase
MQIAARLGFAVLAVWGALACGGDPGGDRVLLVGIDGATLRVVRPLMEQGRLPHLSELAAQGVFGPLRAQLPLFSPRIWNSIATGKIPAKHGILNFAYQAEGENFRRLYLSSDRTARALWNIVSDAGLTVGVVNWWNTYPPEPINGVVVSDHVVPSEIQGRKLLSAAEVPPGLGPVTYPADWRARVAEALREGAPLTSIEDPFADAATLPRWSDPRRLSKHYRVDQTVTRIALGVERDIRPDLLMVFLPGIDRVSHVLWGALEPEGVATKAPPWSPEERRSAALALQGYYEFTDGLLGRLMERYGDQDLVMVVSDHGFESGSTLDNTTGIHVSRKSLHGLIFARGRGIGPAPGSDPVRVLDVTPTVLAWLGLAVAADMDGVVAPFLSGIAVREIATYEGAPSEPPESLPSGAEQVILKQLEDLGYFEESDGS